MLERIAKKRTLADGYMANDRLKVALKGSIWFYGFQALIVALSFAYTTISAPPQGSEIGMLILSFQATIAVAVLVGALILCLIYAGLTLALSYSASKDSPTGSTLVSLFSLLVHTLTLVGAGVLIVGSIYSVATSSSGGVALGSFVPNRFTALGIAGLVNLAIWLVLLFSTVGRSYEAFAAALRRVPGRYEYAYGTTVMSSTGRPSEVRFIESALESTAGYSDQDAEGIVEGDDRYLIRFLHRSGKVVAASLQDSSNRRLMAIFPGRESKKLNIAILLEDSYTIQKERSQEAQGTLKEDSLISEIAAEIGWTVSSDGESLISLRRH